MRLQQKLGIDFPVIQAPMAGAQDSTLAAAVSNAGGLGSLPAATYTPAALRDALHRLTALTARPYNVNVFCHTTPAPDARREQGWRAALAPYYREQGVGEPGIDPATAAGSGRAPFSADVAAVLSEFRPPIVSFHFGLPAPELLATVKGWGAVVLSSATTVDEARWLEAHGADVVIAQGAEAGGHRGSFLDANDPRTQPGTFALLPQIVRAVTIPVVAAGGIVDAPTVAAAQSLGAAGVQCGTVYLLCPEATISPVYREALRAARQHGADTALTNLFTGRPARGLVNRLMRELGPLSDLPPAFPLATAAIAPLRSHAEKAGRGDFSSLWCGQNASGCREVPAAEITRDLAQAWR